MIVATLASGSEKNFASGHGDRSTDFIDLMTEAFIKRLNFLSQLFSLLFQNVFHDDALIPSSSLATSL